MSVFVVKADEKRGGQSIRQFCRNLGINHSLWSRILRGQRTPSADVINALLECGSVPQEFVQMGHQELTEFFTHVPCLDVQMELATERDEHRDRKVQPNDMIDIFALSVAIPYCDIVITERFWVDLATRKGLSKKYGTVMLSRIENLPDHL